MKVLVISKPIYDNIMPLVEFPNDGDNFYINSTTKSLSNVGSLTAITLAKYGIDVSYTGMVGEDDIGLKIKEIFNSYKVDTKYIETSYTERTCVSHKIYNMKTNKFTNINEICLKTNLTKFKYEFIPDIVIMDDKEYQANLAALNNYPNTLTIFLADKYTKESSVYLNRCKYVISNLKFASDATGVVNDLNKPKNIINLFQKYTDLYKSNLIIKLDNFDLLYCIDDEVRLIKNVNKNITNKDNVYYSILCYFISNNFDIENAIKFTNKAMLSSSSELDMIKNIPDYNVINECINEYKSILKEQTNIQNNMENTMLSNNTINNQNELNKTENIDILDTQQNINENVIPNSTNLNIQQNTNNIVNNNTQNVNPVNNSNINDNNGVNNG